MRAPVVFALVKRARRWKGVNRTAVQAEDQATSSTFRAQNRNTLAKGRQLPMPRHSGSTKSHPESSSRGRCAWHSLLRFTQTGSRMLLRKSGMTGHGQLAPPWRHGNGDLLRFVRVQSLVGNFVYGAEEAAVAELGCDGFSGWRLADVGNYFPGLQRSYDGIAATDGFQGTYCIQGTGQIP